MKQVFLTFQKHYFQVFSLFAVLIYLAQRLEISLPALANNYLNDFLCMPIVLKICLEGARFIKSDNRLQLPPMLCFTVTLLFAGYFEGYLPIINARYTQDPWDLLCYAAGMCLFFWLERRIRTE
ncbi:hypothetical protein [Maribacter aurantiacus]|uniref:Magnesium citrate secondary transporter n=1 Tax=Maribacter aurantiacus TaxID=1882343 RepID=A0A5R8MAH6_9FLAO|nr:hypothetical protein [Maribacter aurantiacus]TLF46568.1 hypothetical protein FEK29_01980 [Maribacter aurantiacus]